MSFVDDLPDEIAKAIRYLAKTDEEHGLLSARIATFKFHLGQIESDEYLKVDGTIEERKAAAKTTDNYKQAVDEMTEDYEKFKVLDNERDTRARLIEMWRTYSSNKRQGVI